jgi:hypothetical protein
MAKQHTKGKWRLDTRTDYKTNLPSYDEIKSEESKSIATVWGRSGEYNSFPTPEEAAANARLIAAAPELLEVLEALLHEYTTTDFDIAGLDELLITKAKAAIAKAKGGDQ